MTMKAILPNDNNNILSKDVSIPDNFDWEWYLKLNSDLINAGLSSKEGAIIHWLRYGHKENRDYSDPGLIDPSHIQSNRTPLITFKKFGKYGRMGNQIFQIAALINFSKRESIDYFIPNWTTENGEDLTKIFKGPFSIDPNLNNILTKNYHENSLDYSKIPRLGDHMNIQGYFQNELYFIESAKEIRDIFSPIPELEKEILQRNKGLFEGCCSIHVRRGDYLKHSEVHLNLQMDYYKEAMQKSRSNKFLVFSDDINWCKENFKGESFMFSDRNTKNFEDLFLMTFCDSHIIANSTYSWWGAWLGRNPKKTIIAPKRWFGPKGPKQHNVVPNEWITI